MGLKISELRAVQGVQHYGRIRGITRMSEDIEMNIWGTTHVDEIKMVSETDVFFLNVY